MVCHIVPDAAYVLVQALHLPDMSLYTVNLCGKQFILQLFFLPCLDILEQYGHHHYRDDRYAKMQKCQSIVQTVNRLHPAHSRAGLVLYQDSVACHSRDGRDDQHEHFLDAHVLPFVNVIFYDISHTDPQ